MSAPKIGQKLTFVSEIKAILDKQYVLAGIENDENQLQFLHIARIGLSQKIKKDVINLFLSGSAKADFTTVNYNGIALTTVKADNFNICYAVISDCLIVCKDEAILKRAVDLGLLRSKNSLNASQRFIDITKRIVDKNVFLWGWIDYDAGQNIQKLAGQNAVGELAASKDEPFDMDQPFSDVCWQVSLGKEIKLDVVSVIDQKKLALDSPASRMIKALIDQEASGEIINFFPASTLLFFNYNFRDAVLGYGYFKNAALQSSNGRLFGNFNDSVNKIEEKLGIDIERELIPCLGKEVGLGLLDIGQGSNGFPSPGILFAAGLKDPDKFQSIIERIYNKAISDASSSKDSAPLDKKEETIKEPEAVLIAGPKFILASEDYKGTKINFIQSDASNSLGQAAKLNLPCFAIKGNFFLASPTVQQIKDSIDLFDSKGANFKTSPGLINMGEDFKKDDFLFYLDSRGLADRLIMLFAPLMKVNQQISEIANIIRAIKSIGANSTYNSGDFVSKVRVDLGD
jgi:hypothetical protein